MATSEEKPTDSDPEKWKSVKVSENLCIEKIPKQVSEKWKDEIRKKDSLDSLRKIEGYHFAPHGRSGTIYFINSGRVCEIDWEMSGVPELDILIFEETLNLWRLPVETEMTFEEKSKVKEGLRAWLLEQNLRADIFAERKNASGND